MAYQEKNLAKSFAVLGCDTDIGKTFVTRLLVSAFQKQGFVVETQKWIQCGAPHDIVLHNDTPKNPLTLRMPYCFDLPASPHLAAKNTQVLIDEKHILSSFYEIRKTCDMAIIEGSGGLMVPLSDKRLFIDLIADAQIPVLLIVPQRIGCINQSLGHIELLRTRNIPILGVIINEHSPTGLSESIKADHITCIESFGNTCVLETLDYQASTLNETLLLKQLEKEPCLC